MCRVYNLKIQVVHTENYCSLVRSVVRTPDRGKDITWNLYIA
jgi:hypothetical protein